MKRNSRVESLKVEYGFTLVEILVSLLLSALLMLGVSKIFLANKETFALTQGLSRVQENARFALDQLTSELRMVGFGGCNSNPKAVVNLVDVQPNDDVPDAEFNNFTSGIMGFEGETSAWAPVLPADSYWTGVSPRAETDVLFVRAVENSGRYVAEEITPAATSLKLVSTTGIAANDVVMLSDCRKSALISVTGTGTANTIDKAVANNLAISMTTDGTNFGPDAVVNRLSYSVYYVADSADANNRNTNTGALWRKTNGEAAVELVSGIEDMQILYGEDSDDDGIPNQYRSAKDADMDKVVAVKVMIVSNSIDQAGSEDPIARTFSQTILLRNKRASS